MEALYKRISKTPRPITILQYGEGNFLRGFVEYMVDIANEKGLLNGGVQIIKPIPMGSIEPLRAQDCVYTVLLRGKKDSEVYTEKRIITSVAGVVDAYSEYERYAAFAENPELRFIISNTTEAGIVYDETDDIKLSPPKSYPGKLTKFLFDRYNHFNGAADKGFIILPVELIEKNGEKLLECCLKLANLWCLSDGFKAWLTDANIFCNTLVDRIVTGYPKDEAAELEKELGYEDKMIVTGEPFALWVIESKNPEAVAREFPLDKAGLPVIFTADLQPYRERKVRILNGAHTSSVLAAYLAGLNTVEDMMKDKQMRSFIERAVYTELAPMVPLPQGEVKTFADSVIERFENPFIKHNLLSISLNSISKFKARVLPTILETQSKINTLPKALCFSLAALMAFYRGDKADGKWIGRRNGDVYEISDDAAVLDFFAANKNLPANEFTSAFLARADFWGGDLTAVPGLAAAVAESLQSIYDNGIRGAMETLLNEGLQ